jgi:hypothetical protein
MVRHTFSNHFPANRYGEETVPSQVDLHFVLKRGSWLVRISIDYLLV